MGSETFRDHPTTVTPKAILYGHDQPGVTGHHRFCRHQKSSVTTKIAAGPVACHSSPPKLPSAYILSVTAKIAASIFFFFFGFFLLCLGGVHQPYVLSVTTKIATSLIVSHCHQLLLNLPQHRLSVTNGTIIMLCFQGL